MAGKTWSEQEEEYFWLHIIPFSRRRRGVDLANPELSFQQLAEMMRTALGENARRQYTALTLEQHYYQNIETSRISRNARKWVKQYKALVREYPGLPEKSSRATHEVNNEVEPTHVATKAGAETDWELGGDENAEKRAAILKLAGLPEQEQEVQAENPHAPGDGLFSGPFAAGTPGYDSDRTISEASDEIIGGTHQSGAGGAAKAPVNPRDNNSTEAGPAGADEGAEETAADTIVVGGFPFSEDDSSAGEDSDDQSDENESVREEIPAREMTQGR